uniref:Uncharacterized protein n=1 Tax=Oryza meridionalis TaxID=40149 RepID=A0A0E0DW77_9ORYZ
MIVLTYLPLERDCALILCHFCLVGEPPQHTSVDQPGAMTALPLCTNQMNEKTRSSPRSPLCSHRFCFPVLSPNPNAAAGIPSQPTPAGEATSAHGMSAPLGCAAWPAPSRRRRRAPGQAARRACHAKARSRGNDESPRARTPPTPTPTPPPHHAPSRRNLAHRCRMQVSLPSLERRPD